MFVYCLFLVCVVASPTYIAECTYIAVKPVIEAAP